MPESFVLFTSLVSCFLFTQVVGFFVCMFDCTVLFVFGLPYKTKFLWVFFLRLLHYRNPFTSIYFEKLTIFFIGQINPVYFAVLYVLVYSVCAIMFKPFRIFKSSLANDAINPFWFKSICCFVSLLCLYCCFFSFYFLSFKRFYLLRKCAC